jgi:endonuclease YncB( thermonuclease family)
MSLSRRLLLSLSLLAGLSACAQPSRDGRRYDRERVTQALADLDRSALVLGEFPLTKVIDGDTIRVDGLDQSHRLIGLDTEETFKTERDRRAFENGWESYLVKAQAKTRSPVKIPTPPRGGRQDLRQGVF